MAGDILPGLTPQLKAELFQAFDLQILWNKTGRQATVFAEITDATLKALPGILDPGRDGYDDTADADPGDPGSVEHLFESPIRGVNTHDVELHADGRTTRHFGHDRGSIPWLLGQEEASFYYLRAARGKRPVGEAVSPGEE